jgi:hypothetical protein
VYFSTRAPNISSHIILLIIAILSLTGSRISASEGPKSPSSVYERVVRNQKSSIQTTESSELLFFLLFSTHLFSFFLTHYPFLLFLLLHSIFLYFSSNHTADYGSSLPARKVRQNKQKHRQFLPDCFILYRYLVYCSLSSKDIYELKFSRVLSVLSFHFSSTLSHDFTTIICNPYSLCNCDRTRRLKMIEVRTSPETSFQKLWQGPWTT